MNIFRFPAAFLFLLLAACAKTPTPPTPAVPSARDSAVIAESEANGLALYKAFVRRETSSDSLVVQAAAKKIKNFCEFEYAPVVVSESVPTVYFIAKAPAGSVVLGRHFKVVDMQITLSTDGCLEIAPPPDQKLAGIGSTYLRGTVPSEFHVFLSLLHDKPVFVHTQFGRWKVEDGQISVLSDK